MYPCLFLLLIVHSRTQQIVVCMKIGMRVEFRECECTGVKGRESARENDRPYAGGGLVKDKGRLTDGTMQFFDDRSHVSCIFRDDSVLVT